MSAQVLYEQPLNERIRTFLRLEHFFGQATHFLNGDAPYDTQAGIGALIEILSILERNDIRSEVLKEVERHIAGLSKLLDSPTVDRQKLDSTLSKLTKQAQLIQQGPSKWMLELRENELLNTIRQRTAISAGGCGFDLPAYHYLLNQTSLIRSELLSRWLSDFNPIKDGVYLLLNMLRNSSLFETMIAENGFYQKALDTTNPVQLVRITLPKNIGIYPEVSGSKHRISVRFLTFSETERAKQLNYSQTFEMSCCVI